MEQKKSLWEILVPTHSNNGAEYAMSHHHAWDDYVRGISGGLTILKTSKGQWLDETGRLFSEKMIPVRVACTESDIDQIIKYTLSHYEQKAVIAYEVSTKVKIVHEDDSAVHSESSLTGLCE